MKRLAALSTVPWPLSWKDVAYETISKGQWMARVFWLSCKILDDVDRAAAAARKQMRVAAAAGQVLELAVPRIDAHQAYLEACSIVAQEDELARHTTLGRTGA